MLRTATRRRDGDGGHRGRSWRWRRRCTSAGPRRSSLASSRRSRAPASPHDRRSDRPARQSPRTRGNRNRPVRGRQPPRALLYIFALQAGLVAVVQASLIGSILGNALLVLGLAFVAGGWRHGMLRFEQPNAADDRARCSCSRSPRSCCRRWRTNSTCRPARTSRRWPWSARWCSLTVFAVSTRAMLDQRRAQLPAEAHARGPAWPLATAVGVLAAAASPRPSSSSGSSQRWSPRSGARHQPAFAGLVVVAIAGNAVEQVVGIQLAGRGKASSRSASC